MLDIVREATCTTHLVGGESEAIQMFIFQNNRGRRPSNLEIVKAQFMHNVHLYGGSNVDILIEEIKSRFEVIYKAISSIEDYIDEDSILLYTQRAYFNSLWQTNTLDKIDEMLSKDDSVDFVMSFTRDLSTNFQHLSEFFVKHERESFAIHSLITLGGFAIGLPFIIKAYRFGLPISKIEKLCSSLETLVLRHRLIGTRADMTSRISDVFEKFTDSNKSIDPIIERIKYLKVVDASTEWFWAYWNNENLEASLKGSISHSVAKYLLWKYEIHLNQKSRNGYLPPRFDRIISPELEHIAPLTEPSQKPHGYDDYDDLFKN